MTNFDQAAVSSLFGEVVSTAAKLGDWASSPIQHEPKAPPSSLPALALWWAGISPVPALSGAAAVTGVVTFHGRIYLNGQARPEDNIDPQLLALASDLLGALSGGFTLNGTVMAVDLLGQTGEKLAATAGWIDHGGTFFRVAEVVVPVIVDDLWQEVA